MNITSPNASASATGTDLLAFNDVTDSKKTDGQDYSSSAFAEILKNVIPDRPKQDEHQAISENFDTQIDKKSFDNQNDVKPSENSPAASDKNPETENSKKTDESKKSEPSAKEIKPTEKKDTHAVFEPKVGAEKSFRLTDSAHPDQSVIDAKTFLAKSIALPEKTTKTVSAKTGAEVKTGAKKTDSAKTETLNPSHLHVGIKPELALQHHLLQQTGLKTGELKTAETETEGAAKKSGKLSIATATSAPSISPNQALLSVSQLIQQAVGKTKDGEQDEKAEALKKSKDLKNVKAKQDQHTQVTANDIQLGKNETALVPKIENTATVEAPVKKETTHEKSDWTVHSNREIASQGYSRTADIQVLRTQSTELLQKIVGQIRHAIVSGREEMTMKIQPEHLGKITLTLGKEVNGLLTGTMIVENAAVKEMLDSQMLSLKDHLQAMGFDFSQMNVDVRQDNQDASSLIADEDTSVKSSQASKISSDEESLETIDLRYSEKLVNLVA